MNFFHNISIAFELKFKFRVTALVRFLHTVLLVTPLSELNCSFKPCYNFTLPQLGLAQVDADSFHLHQCSWKFHFFKQQVRTGDELSERVDAWTSGTVTEYSTLPYLLKKPFCKYQSCFISLSICLSSLCLCLCVCLTIQTSCCGCVFAWNGVHLYFSLIQGFPNFLGKRPQMNIVKPQ